MVVIPPEERRTLILTSASRGIGHATVKRLSSAGWRVISCSRDAFPEDCPWEAGPGDHIQVDLGDPDSTLGAIAEMKNRLKAQGSRLNALVNMRQSRRRARVARDSAPSRRGSAPGRRCFR